MSFLIDNVWSWGRAKNEISYRSWNLYGITRKLRFKQLFKITLDGNSTSYTERVQYERYDLKKLFSKMIHNGNRQYTYFQNCCKINMIYICMIITVFVSRTHIRRFGIITKCVLHSDNKYACTLSRTPPDRYLVLLK